MSVAFDVTEGLHNVTQYSARCFGAQLRQLVHFLDDAAGDPRTGVPRRHARRVPWVQAKVVHVCVNLEDTIEFMALLT